METGLSRRTLIGGTAAAAVSLGLPRLGRAEQDAPKVGWAILGLGGYATHQIMPAFKDCTRSKIVALVSGTPDKLKRFGEQYSVPESHRYSYETFDRIKDNPDVQVVYVVTPPATHRDFVVRAAGAGKHVCSEKPMAPTVADCQAMIDACRKAGKRLQIGYRSHYEANNLRAMELCRSGALGTLRSITSDHGFNMPAGTWRTVRKLAGGGSMMDIGIYSVQALCYLAGEDPTEVFATIHNLPEERFKDVEDTVHFRLKLPSGVQATGTSGYSWAPGANRYDVIGTRGGLHAEPATSYGGNTLRGRGTEGVTPNNQFAAQIDHLSQCIQEDKPVKTPGEMGLRDIRIIQAIYESARTGMPVRL
ncbi:MAG: Gfo/Idh/MocA family protein [Fimbriimonas sp.]